MNNSLNKIKIGNKMIEEGKPVFIIAEAGSNHNRDFEQAKKLIDVAAKTGVNAIKFQLFRASTVYLPNCGKIPTFQGELDLYNFFKRTELPIDWLIKLKKYAENKGLIFLASVFDEKLVDKLEEIKIVAYKIASPELNHLPLLRYVAKKKKPIILSLGLSTLSDIEEAINTIYEENNHQIVLLHCVSSYPAPPEDYNLNVIETLKKVFQIPVGVSDHSLDPILIPKLSVAVGALIIEKHFTLSKKLKGADHPFSLEPNELKLMVKEVREVEKWSQGKRKKFLDSKPFYKKILGTSQKIITPSEKILYPGDKRSIFVIKNIKKGEKLTKRNLAILRAERYLLPGIHPRYFDLVLGKKVIKPIKKYTGLKWDYLF